MLAITIGAFALGVAFGARSLNLVVVSGAVALVAGYFQLRSVTVPQVSREVPPDDFVGKAHTVRLRFLDPVDGGQLRRPPVASVCDDLGAGLTAETPGGQLGDGSPIDYTVRYTARGEHRLGPTTFVVRDVFGLLETRKRRRGTDSCLVYPPRYSIALAQSVVSRGDSVDVSRQRDEFDRLREYDRGDSLRDIHWPTTAKRDELVVKSFAAPTGEGDLTLSGGAASGRADELATAVTSVALALLDLGLPITVSLPNGTLSAADSGATMVLLTRLATVGPGAVPDPDADIVVDAGREDTTVQIGETTWRFEDLKSGSEPITGPIPDSWGQTHHSTNEQRRMEVSV
ncbi:DUF58 domain-containing protein [Halalkalirubrum salinum]|uniref:DUF58 domain-containing protein n=1 Tax=Halalkalirubrum salinum TaxID=2563889 RepID=UPI0014852CFB|nr:DUF58 domain-containing protein [Halalkalirubrum salinum]